MEEEEEEGENPFRKVIIPQVGRRRRIKAQRDLDFLIETRVETRIAIDSRIETRIETRQDSDKYHAVTK